MPLKSALLAFAAAAPLSAQPTADSPLAAPANGMTRAEPGHHVLVNAAVHPRPGVVWETGFVVFRDGVITAAGPGPHPAAPGAIIHDLSGEHVYAAFIDPFVEIPAPDPDQARPGAHWNSAVHPDRDALDGGGVPEATAKKHRGMGFGAAVAVPAGGVFAGTAAAVSLAEKHDDPSLPRPAVYRDRVFHTIDFETRGWSSRSYPTSTPGAVALVRQTLLDAAWQDAWEPTLNGANPLNALSPLEDPSVPLLFTLDHELEHFIASDIAAEAGRASVAVGNGMEFKWLDGIAEIGRPIILPLRFPAEPDVSSVGKAESVELETMMTWEQAPTNPRRLAEKLQGTAVALTAGKLPEGRGFRKELRTALEHGLAPETAHAMLTTAPASIAGLDSQLGTIEPGKRANLLVASGPLFDLGADDSELYDIWIDGARHPLADRPGLSIDGGWRLWVGDETNPDFEMTLEISGSAGGGPPTITATERWAPDLDNGERAEPHSADARKVSFVGERISFLLDDEDDEQVTYILSGALVGTDRMLGTGVASDDSAFAWAARKTEPAEETAPDEDSDAPEIKDTPPLPGYPFGPYARRFEPVAETLLFTNATVWTGTDRGRLEQGWVLIMGGRIARLEPGSPPGWLLDGSNSEIVVVDVSGKHITPGLVDAHSHTSLFRFGVNEAGQAVTAEVRIGDSLDPAHINWYRQLAMGVTTVNSLHGSANPIGGQNAVHKVRWGVKRPRDMLLTGARPGIKFALGENVKQSNWDLQRNERTRYPQTRMGVETLIRDRLEAARAYREEWDVAAAAFRLQRGGDPGQELGHDSQRALALFSGHKRGELDARTAARLESHTLVPPRRDLELEALAEILTGERLIHCHSYRQDEILMLCRIAEDFGFQIGTFQHGLEVYKVPEAVRANAIGASLFSDWWMYKVEVMDAIPFAGPLQTEAGVLTSYNSDSDELARRLNTEAAKAVKYARPGSGLTEHDALRFVTANAAQQIGAGSTGRLEESLDADLVIWSGSPLSTMSRVETVYVDGAEAYSIEQDRLARRRIASERQRLIQKILASPKRKKPENETDEGGPADDPERRRTGVLADWMRSGFHPDDMRPGDCGCGIINHELYYLDAMEYNR